MSDSAATTSGADTTMDAGSDPTIGSSTEPASSTDPTASATLSTADGADSSTSDTDPTGSTDDGGPLCGNRMIDDDEVCDDGNDVNGDGCNVDCVESGTLLWEFVLPNASAIDVAVSDDDVVAFMWGGGGGPHIDMFDSDGAASGSLDGPVGEIWESFDVFGNGDFALAVQAGSGIQIARITGAGAELWSSGAPGSGSAQGGDGRNVVATTDDDEVAFAGSADAAIWSGKFDGAGAFDWIDVFTEMEPGWGRGTGMACEPDGTCVVSGYVDTNDGPGGKELFLRRLSPGGVEIWTRTYTPVGGTFLDSHVAIAPTGDIAVAGYEGPGYDAGDIWVRSYTNDGDPQWTYVYDNPNHGTDQPWGIASDVDGNFVVVGHEGRYDLGEDLNGVIKKLDSDGNELWTRTYSGIGAAEDEATSVATDSTGRIFVVGSTRRTDGDDPNDAWIRAYAP